MVLGLSNGTNQGGLNVASSNSIMYSTPSYYGQDVGYTGPSNVNQLFNGLGVTTDSTKSGLVAAFSGLTLGTIPSEKLGGFYIRC